MYLVEIDRVTGLVKVDGLHDGVMAIKEFRELIDEPSLGVEAMTCVAFVVDWLTPIRYYSEADRPKRAMYDVTGNRRAFVWNQELIQRACVKYMELQHNPDLLEKTKLDNMILKKLQDIENESDDAQVIKLFSQLNSIKELRKRWEKENEDRNIYSDSPVVNGYKLSRLEAKLLDKRSFYNT